MGNDNLPQSSTRHLASAFGRFSISTMGITLGAAAVGIAFAIGLMTYSTSLRNIERRQRMSFLAEAQILASVAETHQGQPEEQILAELRRHWRAAGPLPADEYICIVNSRSQLLLHSAHPDTVGSDAGDNLLLDGAGRTVSPLRSLVTAQDTYVGKYRSSAGQEQIAAFAPVTNRGWTVGVHRSHDVVVAEAQAEIWFLAVGFLFACGLLMPCALWLQHRACQAALHRSQQAERASKEGEHRLRLIVENMPVMLDAFDAHGGIVAWNAECERVSGYSANEIVGNPRAMELLYPDSEYRDRMLQEWQPRTDNYRDRELTLTAKNGDTKTIAWSSISDRVSVPGWATWRCGIDVTERIRAAERLRNSEERYSELVEGTKDLVTRVDANGLLTYVNPVAERVFGVPDRSCLGRLAFDFAHPEDRNATEQWFRDTAAKRAIQATLENRQVNQQTGEVFHLLWTSTFHYDDAGQLTHVGGIAHDITERKRLEQELCDSRQHLADSNNLLQTTLDYTHMMVVYLDPTFNFIKVNPAYAQTCGREPSFFPGKNHFELYPHEENQAIFQRVVDTGKPHFVSAKPFEFPDQPERGITYWDWSLIPVKSQNGAVTGLVFTLAEVTETVKAEQALRKSEQRFRELATLLPETIFEMDTEGRLTFANDNGLETFGYTPEDLERGLYALDMLVSDQRARAQGNLERLFAGETLPGEEYAALRKDGTSFPVAIYSAPICYEHTVRGVRGIIVDITERRNAEQSHQMLFDTMIDGFAVHEVIYSEGGTPVDYRFLAVNPAFERLTGLRREDLIGNTVLGVLPRTEAHWIETYGRVATTGERVHFEHYSREIDKDFEVTAYRTGPGEFACTFVDVTERKLAEASLRKSEEKYKALFEQAGDYLLVLQAVPDEAPTIIDVNEAACQKHGYKREELIGQSLSLLDSSLDNKRIAKLVQQVLSGAPVRFETVHGRKDGSTFPVEVSARLVELPDSPPFVLSIERDITERKQAESAVREESRLRNILLDSLPCMAMVLKKKTREIVASNAVAKEVGAVPGETCFGTCAGRDDQCPFCRAPQLWATDKPQRQEVEYRGKHYLLIWVPFSEELYVHYIFDTTEQKQLERQQRELQRQLVQSQKLEAVGQLAGGIAHDFNNVLNIVIGHASMATDAMRANENQDTSWGQQSEILDDVEKVIQASKRAARLARQLLTFTRKRKGDIRATDLRTIVMEVRGTVRNTFDRRIETVFRIAEELPEVLGDSGQIHQVLLNLCVNARDAVETSKDKRITVEVEAGVVGEQMVRPEWVVPGRFNKISVSDTGIGMNKETLEHMFEPFFTTKEVGKGTGIGLATSYSIVKQHGGFMNVESEVGKGTTVSFWLPVAAEASSGKVASKKDQEPSRESLQGTETVLFVDDEPGIIRLGNRLLGKQGYTVLTAEDGAQALDTFEREGNKIDLVVLDLSMPRMSGDELLKELRNMNAHVKVIVTSGLVTDVVEKRLESLDVSAVLPKPIDWQELVRTVRVVLDAG